jgi:hypothetical protein
MNPFPAQSCKIVSIPMVEHKTRMKPRLYTHNNSMTQDTGHMTHGYNDNNNRTHNKGTETASR